MSRLIIRCEKDELDWVEHAAALRGWPLSEYVRRAINRQLRREGVDAVLFKEREEPRPARSQEDR